MDSDIKLITWRDHDFVDYFIDLSIPTLRHTSQIL